MDGLTLTTELRQLLQEIVTGSWMDTKFTYDCLYAGAIATASSTHCITSSQSITTVASQTTYKLNGDFLKLYMEDSDARQFIKYYDGSGTTFIYHSPYDSIFLANQTTAVSIPSVFTINDAADITRLSGTVTTGGTLSNGEVTLTDSTANFTDIYPGDFVHNVTDGSYGVVIVKTSTTALICCLFGGTDNDFDLSDAYFINPQKHFQLILDPPPSTSGHIITVPYVQKPNPVYSNYRAYQMPLSLKDALVFYAAWKYKYRDKEVNFGDSFYQHWGNIVKRYGRDMNSALKRTGYRVILNKRASKTGSYR